MALEQTINRAQKNVSGIIGSSKKKQYVAKWEIVYHEMLAITNLHRELAGLGTTSYELDVYKPGFQHGSSRIQGDQHSSHSGRNSKE